MHQASVPPLPSRRKLKTTVAGPSRRQVLVKCEPVPAASSFPSLVGVANRSLAKVDLRVDSCVAAYGGISLLTSRVASPEEIQVIAAAIHQHLGRDVQAALPTSRSYLKIVDVPYFCPGSKDFIDSGYVREVMRRSHMASSFTLANSPRVMRNSRHADSATVWFDVVDSQSGAVAKRLINSSFQFGPASCPVRPAQSHADLRRLVARAVLVPIRRPTIALSLVVVVVTPRLTPLCQLRWREPHALTPPAV
ncbi:hypothetical protein AN958_05790 [Leucoagaricus sp. SymC.cos]|nr:hypothetical protein AN958_05790 [Leucoagaricus sp. SymC.cos]